MPLANASAFEAEYDVCVVGAGPAGLACAFDCHDAGLKVLLLEAGGERPVPGDPDLLAAEITNPSFHDPVDIVAAHALGGSSHWWGGRSVPFDEADFRFWPLAYADMLPWWDKAADFLGSKSVSESPPPPAFAKLKHFDALRDECWGPELNMGKRWRARVHATNGPAIALGARVTGLVHDSGRINALNVRMDGAEHRVRAKTFALTGGGLGTLRLLLLAQRETPALFGGPNGPLGRGYMGHLTGSIAELELADKSDIAAFVCRPLGDGVFARRRIRPHAGTVTNENIVNLAFWLDNGAVGDPAHGSSVASARYLAARAVRTAAKLGRSNDKTPLGPHIANVARAPFTATAGLASAAWLLASARLTGRHPRATTLTPVRPGAYAMHYHAEQPRESVNRISLSADQTDSLGLPKLKIDFQMHDAEIDAIVRTHALLDADLQAAGAGKLTMHGGNLAAQVRDYARDGYHQLGGAIMSTDARDGVVTTDLRAHDLENLYLAAGCVFPSSGQANPTLTIVALARRLAAHLARRERSHERESQAVSAN